MKTASITAMQSQFGVYLKASAKGPVIVTRKGKAVAVLLAMEDQGELERLALAYSPKFRKIIRTAKEQIRKGAGIPHNEFWSAVESKTQK